MRALLARCLRPIIGGILMAVVSLAIIHMTGPGLLGLLAAGGAAGAVYLPLILPMRHLIRPPTDSRPNSARPARRHDRRAGDQPIQKRSAMQISQGRSAARSAAKFLLSPVMRGNSLVVFEARNKVVRFRTGRATHQFEDAEVARLTRQLGELPRAKVASVVTTSAGRKSCSGLLRRRWRRPYRSGDHGGRRRGRSARTS